MIFEKDNVSFQILDVFYYVEGENDTYNPKHAFDDLSFKIKCNAKYTFNKNTETLTDHSIAYIPGSIISDCQNKYNESIAIHLKVHNYSTDRVEKFIPPDYSKYEKLFRELLECWTRKTGQSFREYLVSVRLKAAKSLLCHSRLSITEIAFSVGFSDSNYFSNVFKAKEGITPGKYRKLNS